MTRWIDIALAFHIALQLGWHVRYGNIFTTAETDVSIRPVIWLAATVAVLYSGLQLIASGIAFGQVRISADRRCRCRTTLLVSVRTSP